MLFARGYAIDFANNFTAIGHAEVAVPKGDLEIEVWGKQVGDRGT